MSASLCEIVPQFSSKKVLLLGDIMLDEYIWGIISRNSPEAPSPVLEVEQVSYTPGGAANVAVNMASLGGKVYLAGVVGTDAAAEKLKTLLPVTGVDVGGLKVDVERPTTLKTRMRVGSQQLPRVDREMQKPIPEPIRQELLAYILNHMADVDLLLISDYAKGVTVDSLLKQVFLGAKLHKKPVVVNPKGRDFIKYKEATLITLNRREAALAADEDIIDETSLIRVGKRLLHQTKCEALLITLDEKGMSLFEYDGSVTHLPTVARKVNGVVGAGDTVIGTLALAFATGLNLADCIQIANYAAGVVVSKVGTATVTVEELQTVLKIEYTRLDFSIG